MIFMYWDAESNSSVNHKHNTTRALTNPFSECPTPQNTMFAYLSIETLSQVRVEN